MTLDRREGGLGNNGLGRGCLLRLRDIGTSILAVVDALPCPGEVRRERVGDLSSRMRECSQIQSNKGDRTNLCGGRDTEKADETDVLVPGDLDLINRLVSLCWIAKVIWLGTEGGFSQLIFNSCPRKDSFLTMALASS